MESYPFDKVLEGVSFNPKVESTLDLWMNDEIQLSINSDLGNFSLSKDTWGFAFL